MMLLVWWWWEKWVGTEVGPLFVTSLALCCSGGLRCDPLVSLVVQSGWGWAAWPYMGIISWWTDQSGGGWLGIEVFSFEYIPMHMCAGSKVQHEPCALCCVGLGPNLFWCPVEASIMGVYFQYFLLTTILIFFREKCFSKIPLILFFRVFRGAVH